MPMEIAYGHWQTSEQEFVDWAAAWARAHPGASICDVGGGANPVLGEADRSGRRYVVLDVDEEELEKSPEGVEKVCADAAVPGFRAPGTFDLVLSSTTVEHIADPRRFHANVREMLHPGGLAAHYFPALGALPFVVNRYLPEEVGEQILLRIQPTRRQGGHHEKFPALYRGCRGPTRRQKRLYESAGFEVERFVGYFGHGYYWPVSRLERLEKRKTAWLLRHPVPALAAYATVVLRAV